MHLTPALDGASLDAPTVSSAAEIAGPGPSVGEPADDSLDLRDQPTEQAPASIWSWNYQSKSQQLAQFFGLSAGEVLLDDYTGALRRRLLHQGRLYVFEHHLCFYSNVFGLTRKRCIAFKDISRVRKTTHLHFPNSIEVEYNGTKDFFTSLFSRDDAFQAIVTARDNDRKPVGDIAPPTDDRDSGELPEGQTSRPPLPPRFNTPPRTPPSSSPGRISRQNTVDVHGTPPRRTLRKSMTAPSDADTGARNDMGRSLLGNLDTGIVERSGSASSSHSNSRSFGLGTGEEEEYTEEESIVTGLRAGSDDVVLASMWIEQAIAAPTPDASQRVLVRDVQLPAPPRAVVAALLGPTSALLPEFHAAQGDTQVKLTRWQQGAELEQGSMRDMTFVTPIKGAFASWGTPAAQCCQLQRFRVFSGQHVVWEVQQSMSDIPYGDCFTVNTRWDFKPAVGQGGEEATEMSIWMSVPFSRRCMFKRVIESGSYKSLQESTDILIKMLRSHLEFNHDSPAGLAPGLASAVVLVDEGTETEVAVIGQQGSATWPSLTSELTAEEEAEASRLSQGGHGRKLAAASSMGSAAAAAAAAAVVRQPLAAGRWLVRSTSQATHAAAKAVAGSPYHTGSVALLLAVLVMQVVCVALLLDRGCPCAPHSVQPQGMLQAEPTL